ncbi:hypothetical protein QX995_002166 [Vibrio vulnificus]|nr:hypothetical protein [Vibrio vulnificus]ELP6122757.1 hypothetical protein [Vibrio vulnificus]
MNKQAEYSATHYNKNKKRISERRKQQKTYSKFMEEMHEDAKRQKARFIVENTPHEFLCDEQKRTVIANAFNLFANQEALTESEILQVRKNKRLVQRWQMFLKALEQHINTTIDKRIDAKK